MRNKEISSETTYYVIKDDKDKVVSVARGSKVVTSNSEMQIIIHPKKGYKIERSDELEFKDQEKKLKSTSADPK